MEITLHQTHHKIADFQEIFSYLKKNLDSNSTGLHVFPELFLTGYPLQDVVIQKPFIDAYQSFLKKLEKWLKKTLSRPNLYLLFGGIDSSGMIDVTIFGNLEDFFFWHLVEGREDTFISRIREER